MKNKNTITITLLKLLAILMLNSYLMPSSFAGTNAKCIKWGEDRKDRGYSSWKETIACKESDWNYKADDNRSAYKGKYQMGCPSLGAIGCLNPSCSNNAKLYDIKWAEKCGGSLEGFKSSPETQERIFKEYMKTTFKYVKAECGNLDALIGKTFDCPGTGTVTLTMSGILTAAHLVGPAGSCSCMRAGQVSGKAKYANGNFSVNCKDGNQVSWCTYAALGKNFDVNSITGRKDKVNGTVSKTSPINSSDNKTKKTTTKNVNLDCLQADLPSPKCQDEILPTVCNSGSNGKCLNACFQTDVQNNRKEFFCKRYRKNHCEIEWKKSRAKKPYDKRCGKNEKVVTEFKGKREDVKECIEIEENCIIKRGASENLNDFENDATPEEKSDKK